MSFVQNETGIGYNAGYFLASADCKRVTATIAANHAAVQTAPNGGKYVPAGAIIPANGATAVGILYEDVDVTTGDMPGSVVVAGAVYLDRLPVEPVSAAISALRGIQFTEAPEIVRTAEAESEGTVGDDATTGN